MKLFTRLLAAHVVAVFILNSANTKPVGSFAFEAEDEDQKALLLDKRAPIGVAAFVLFLILLISKLRFPSSKQRHDYLKDYPDIHADDGHPGFLPRHLLLSPPSLNELNLKTEEIDLDKLRECVEKKLGDKSDLIDKLAESVKSDTDVEDNKAIKDLYVRARDGLPITWSLEALKHGPNSEAEEHLSNVYLVEGALYDCLKEQQRTTPTAS